MTTQLAYLEHRRDVLTQCYLALTREDERRDSFEPSLSEEIAYYRSEIEHVSAQIREYTKPPAPSWIRRLVSAIVG